jgi:hypothetical protein
MTQIFFAFNSKSDSSILFLREIDIYLLNLVYLYAKYPVFLTENYQILTSSNNLNSYLNDNTVNIMKSEHFRINNDKFEITYLMKLIFNILISNKGNFKSSFIDNTSDLLLKRLQNLEFTSPINSEEPEDSTKIIKIFIDSLEEFKILTKLTYILDKHKNSIYTLNIMTTKNIESKFVEIQKILISENKEKNLLMINDIIMIFLKNYFHFQYIESKFEERSLSSITEEVSSLIKMMLDEKIFEDKLFSEVYIKQIEKFEILEFQYTKEENTKIYIKFLLEYFKIFEKLVNILYIDNNSKNMSIDLYVHFFHNIMIKILVLKHNTYKEKYISSLKDCIIKQFNNISIRTYTIDYLITFVNNNILYISNFSDLMKNIKILKEFNKFYNSKEVKLNYVNILDALIKNNNEVEVMMNIIVFLRLVESDEDFQTLTKYLYSQESLFKKFIYLDKKICNFWLKNTYTKENEILKKVNLSLIASSISSVDYFEYFLKVFEENMKTNHYEININIYKFVKLINRLVDINNDQKYYSYSSQFDQVLKVLENIPKLNSDNIVADTIQVFLLNKLSVIFTSNKEKFKDRLFESLEK